MNLIKFVPLLNAVCCHKGLPCKQSPLSSEWDAFPCLAQKSIASVALSALRVG